MNQPGHTNPGPGNEHARGLEPSDLPPALERELAGLTAPTGAHSTELADRAWEAARTHAEPKVFVLRRWLAPAAIAASLVLVGLAVTSRTPASRPVNELAFGRFPTTTAMPKSAAGEREEAAPQEASRRELALRGADEVRNSATLEQRVISEAGQDADRQQDGRARTDAAAAPAPSQPGSEPGTPPAPKLAGAEETLKKSKVSEELEDKVASPTKSQAKEADSGAAPAPSKPAAPPADQSAVTRAPADPAAAGEVPVPGGNTSQSRAASQFDAQPWHRDQPAAASGGSAGGLPQPAQALELGSEMAPAQAPAPTVGWARRVFIHGKWWWIGIAALNAVLFVLWWRKLAKGRHEPAPDQ